MTTTAHNTACAHRCSHFPTAQQFQGPQAGQFCTNQNPTLRGGAHDRV